MMQENYKVASATQNTKFRVGQTVWCLLHGKGKVIDTVNWPGGGYPVEVCFESTGESVFYTQDGEYYSDTNRTLFFSEPQVIAATEPVFEPRLVGKVVAVYFGGNLVHEGEVTREDSMHVVTKNFAWLKTGYTFYEVTPNHLRLT